MQEHPHVRPGQGTVLSLVGAPELILAQDALSGQAHTSFTLIHKLQSLSQWKLVSSRKAASERARIYSQGLTPEERSRVAAYKNVLHEYVAGLCGDVSEPEAWRRYGEYNQDTKDFEFIPDSFIEPRAQALALQEVSGTHEAAHWPCWMKMSAAPNLPALPSLPRSWCTRRCSIRSLVAASRATWRRQAGSKPKRGTGWASQVGSYFCYWGVQRAVGAYGGMRARHCLVCLK